MFGIVSGMQIIADRFGDGCHKPIKDIFGGQQSQALFGNRIT